MICSTICHDCLLPLLYKILLHQLICTYVVSQLKLYMQEGKEQDKMKMLRNIFPRPMVPNNPPSHFFSWGQTECFGPMNSISWSKLLFFQAILPIVTYHQGTTVQ